MSKVAEQVAELMQEQKDNIIKAGKKLNLVGGIIIAIAAIFCIGAIVFTYFQPEQETAYSKFEQLEKDYEEKKANCDALREEIEALENEKEAAKFEYDRIQMQQTSFENGELVFKELTDEQKSKMQELGDTIIELDEEILVLLTENQGASQEMDEAYNKMMDAAEEDDDTEETPTNKWIICGICVIVAGVVAMVSFIVAMVLMKKNCPYYSDAKYSYIKKHG